MVTKLLQFFFGRVLPALAMVIATLRSGAHQTLTAFWNDSEPMPARGKNR